MSKVLMVIPCLNEEYYLEPLVRNLIASNTSLPMLIVIADGGSVDATLSIADKLTKEFANVVLLHNPKRIQGAAVNLAVETNRDDAEFLIRIDAHADYPKDYCQSLILDAEQTKAASVVVTMDTVGKDLFQQAVAAAQNSKLGNGGSAHRTAGSEGQWVDHGHHALMRIDAFRAVGGYDETFSHNEDAELDTRLTRGGYKIWLTGKTALTYYPRSSPWPLFLQYMDYGYGRARNMLKHGTCPKLRQLAPALVAPAVLLALASPVIGIAALPLLIWAAICLIYGAIIGLNAHNMRLAAAGPVAMLMHLGWSIGFWKGVWVIQRGGRDG